MRLIDLDPCGSNAAVNEDGCPTPAGDGEFCGIRVAPGGEEDALTLLLCTAGARLRPRLEHKIHPRWRSLLDVDDILQVTYIEAYLAAPEFQERGPGAIEAWLRRIAENNLLDAVRSLEQARRCPGRDRPVLSLGRDSLVAFAERLSSGGPTPSRAAAADELREVLKRALETLPPDYATVVRLYELEGRSAPDVAHTIGRSEGSVYMLRARALERLRRLLGSESLYFSQVG